MSEILLDGNVAFLPGISAAVMVEQPSVKPSSPQVKKTTSSEIIPWGDNNSLPQDVIETTSKSTEFMPLLEKKMAIVYARGFFPSEIIGYDDEGNYKFKPIFDPEILAFLRQNNIERFCQEYLMDFGMFFNCFDELLLSKDRSKIVQIVHQETAYCRYKKTNTKGILDEVVINANWPNAKYDSEESIKIPLVDPYNLNRVQDLRDSKHQRIVYPTHYSTPGKSYYQLAHNYGWIASGWADVSAAIPKWKTALMKNQITVKYLIRIPYTYWIQTYSDWDQKPELQATRKREKLAQVNAWLTDVENTGKSIMTEYGMDQQLQKEIPGWEIKAIDGNKFESGAYIEDSQEASAHLMRSLGIDSAIVGAGPGKKMGAGSGSDKRVAFDIAVATAAFYRNPLIEILNFIADYNGWNERYNNLLQWTWRDTIITTLDKGNDAEEVKQ